MKFRRSLLLLLFLRQNRVKNSQRMRVILPPPRSLHRAGGGGGNNSDYSQGRDYFNAENKNQMRACVAFGGLIYLNTHQRHHILCKTIPSTYQPTPQDSGQEERLKASFLKLINTRFSP